MSPDSIIWQSTDIWARNGGGTNAFCACNTPVRLVVLVMPILCLGLKYIKFSQLTITWKIVSGVNVGSTYSQLTLPINISRWERFFLFPGWETEMMCVCVHVCVHFTCVAYTSPIFLALCFCFYLLFQNLRCFLSPLSPSETCHPGIHPPRSSFSSFTEHTLKKPPFLLSSPLDTSSFLWKLSERFASASKSCFLPPHHLLNW